MRRRAALLALVVATSTYADGLKYVPKWRMVGELACYGIDDSKKLALIDAEVSACLERERLFKLELDALRQENVQTRQALESAIREAGVWKATVTEQQAAYNRCVQQKTACETREATPSAGWFVAGGLALVLVGLVVGLTVVH